MTRWATRTTIVMAWFFASAALAHDCERWLHPMPPMTADLEIYQSSLPPVASVGTREPLYGWSVIRRDAEGKAIRARVRLLADNFRLSGNLAVIGPFNDWGRRLRPGDYLYPEVGRPEIFTAEIDGIQHAMPYRLVLDGRQVLDPTARLFTTPQYLRRLGRLNDGAYLNSIFWDFDHPGLYRIQTEFIDLRRQPLIVAEVEPHGLVARLGDSTSADHAANTYRFIAESGVIERLKQAGYNAVEIMPITQSLDGDSWVYRYQTYGLFAPDSRYGTPDEFKMMIDAFHRQDLAVIADVVVSHFPTGGNEGVRVLGEIGLAQWFKADGRPLFRGERSPWGTWRYDYANPFLRGFLADAVASFVAEYKIDGLRVDNVDGIYQSAGGPEFLRELAATVRSVNPSAFLIGESYSPASPNLLLWRHDRGGIGFNTRTDNNSFEVFRSGLRGYTQDLDVHALADFVRKVHDWDEAPLMRYLSNHDEAYMGRGGLTGAFPRTLIEGDQYAFGKTKAADGFNMTAGAYHLSVPQTRLMQNGGFAARPDIEWSRRHDGSYGEWSWRYFAELSRYIQEHATYFNFHSLHREIENHRDDDNKVVSLWRRDPMTGRGLYVVINLGHRTLRDYKFGVARTARFRVAFDSERPRFGGKGQLQSFLQGQDLAARAEPMHGKPFSLYVPVVAPYSVTILEEDP